MADIRHEQGVDNRNTSNGFPYIIVAIVLLIAVIGYMMWTPSRTTTPIVQDSSTSTITKTPATPVPVDAPKAPQTTAPLATSPKVTPPSTVTP